jgi:SEC-C motif-containing protein
VRFPSNADATRVFRLFVVTSAPNGQQRLRSSHHFAEVTSLRVKCPCHSKKRYGECCGPLHKGTRTAATPEELMRSRYSAFALGEVDYLVSTLCKDHPDKTEDAAAGYRRARENSRFLDLCIMHTSIEGETGEVLFYARIFERGVDCSFVELSGFVKEDGRWRYASGLMVSTKDLPKEPRKMTRSDVLALTT